MPVYASIGATARPREGGLDNTLNPVASNGRARGQAICEQYNYGGRSHPFAHHFAQYLQHQQSQEPLQPSQSYFSASTFIAIMQFSLIRNLTLAVLAGSAVALPAITQDAGSLANVEATQTDVEYRLEKLSSKQAPVMLEKRIIPAIALLQVIGGKLFAGVMSAAIERAKDALAPSADDWKNFDEARTAFMQDHIPDLYNNRVSGTKGVICMNGPYSTSPGAVFEGPATEKFSWDIYHTTYACFEIYSGSVTNEGDGGWINLLKRHLVALNYCRKHNLDTRRALWIAMSAWRD
ncbi:hypothetical protein J3E72DRAFT_273229 [Bipolaris maydis]|nr:hypothetical protein J3E72DRAFT_273229 [Bipolaris maydis]